MAFYDLKSQKVLRVIDFMDVGIRSLGITDGIAFIELSDGLYFDIGGLKRNGIVK